MTTTRVVTLPIALVMKNVRMDWACAIENAEATVPRRLAAPPNTTTRRWTWRCKVRNCA